MQGCSHCKRNLTTVTSQNKGLQFSHTKKSQVRQSMTDETALGSHRRLGLLFAALSLAHSFYPPYPMAFSLMISRWLLQLQASGPQLQLRRGGRGRGRAGRNHLLTAFQKDSPRDFCLCLIAQTGHVAVPSCRTSEVVNFLFVCLFVCLFCLDIVAELNKIGILTVWRKEGWILNKRLCLPYPAFSGLAPTPFPSAEPGSRCRLRQLGGAQLQPIWAWPASV